MSATVKGRPGRKSDDAVLAHASTATLYDLLLTELAQIKSDHWSQLTRQQHYRKLTWAERLARELKLRGTQGRLF